MAPDPVQTPDPASAQLRQMRYFTWEEVAQRSGREKERWLVIDRKVYNISDFIRRHPGGSRVISHYAGQDATVSADNRRVCTLGRDTGGGRGHWTQNASARETRAAGGGQRHAHSNKGLAAGRCFASGVSGMGWIRSLIEGSELLRHPDHGSCSLD